MHDLSVSTDAMKNAAADLNIALAARAKELMDQVNTAIEAIERYKADQAYLDRLKTKQLDIRRILKDLRAKAEFLY